MYLEHFGLQEFPFALTPNTRFLVDIPSYREAIRVLEMALDNGEGFIKVVGEVGTGKTMLCRQLLHELGPQTASAYVPNPALTPRELLQTLGVELGVAGLEGSAARHLTTRIGARLIELRRQGRRVVVIVDEAQVIPDSSFEALRLLTNLETETSKLMQVILFGQPELDVRLAQPKLRQIRQRIVIPHRLRPLERFDVESYVDHRVRVAGWTGGELFRPGTLRLLHFASRGYPRLVNVLAHKALMVAFADQAGHVQRRHMDRAVADTDDARGQRMSSIRRRLSERSLELS